MSDTSMSTRGSILSNYRMPLRRDVRSEFDIVDADGYSIGSGTTPQNVDALLLAVNSHAELLAALRKCVKQFEDMDERQPVDAGCIECTAGTVPNDKNTGLCGYHASKSVIANATGGGK